MAKRKSTVRKPRPVIVERPQEPALSEVEVGLPGLSARFNPQRAAGSLSLGALTAVTALALLLFGMTPVFPGFARADAMQDLVKQSVFDKALMEQTRALDEHKNLLTAQTQALQSMHMSQDQSRKEIMARIVQSNITGSWMRYCEAMRADRIGEADAYRAQIAGLQAEYHAYAGADFPLVAC